MHREEKQYDNALEAMLAKLNNLTSSIGSMIATLETEAETINWPTFLDNFAIIASHITGLSKILGRDICPPLRNRTVLPLLLSYEPDESLKELTNGRVNLFSNDIVPDYLRTKPDPLSEQRMLQNEQKAANLSTEAAMKQVTQYNKVVSHVLDILSKARDEWELDSSSRAGIQQTSSMADTHLLVAAVGMGKGLKLNLPIVVQGSGPGNMMVPPSIRPNTPITSANNQMPKAPSAIKTNIKSAMQVHSFTR